MLRSQKIYEWMLALYPKAHRDAYGQPMAQLFRDQSRAARQEAGWVGVVSLWLRVLPDLVKTSLVEHLAAMKRKRTMTDKISNVIGQGGTPWSIILRVAAPVFLLVFGLSVILTFLMPESFASTARIKLERDVTHSRDQHAPNGTLNLNNYDPYFTQAEFEVLQSELILGKVVASLDLDALWGKKYSGGQKLTRTDAIRILRERMTLRSVRNTSLIEICIYSEDRAEAARLANTIAESYREHRNEERLRLTQGGIKVLEERYGEQLAKVAQAKDQLDALRSKLNVSEVDAQSSTPGPSIEPDALRSMQTQLVETSTRANELRLSLEKLKALNHAELIQVLPRTRQDQLLTEFLSQLNLAEQDLARTKRDFAPDHPQFLRAQEQLKVLNNKVDESVAGIMTAMANQLDIAATSGAMLEKQIESAKQRDLEKIAMTRPYFDKKRELEQLYSFERILQTKLAAERIDLSIPQTAAVEIVDNAVPGMKPVRPNKPLNIALGAFGGMMLALLVGGIAAVIVSQTRKKTPMPTAL